VLAIRVRTGWGSVDFLLWNLVLAWIPVVCALGLEWRRRRDRFGAASIALLLCWLLFLPNAPYLVTDFVHVDLDSPAWLLTLEVAAVLSGAVAGVLGGLLSVLLVQRTLERLGHATAWLLVAVALALASFGMYLGRVVRLNSWDVLTHPHLFASVVAERGADPLNYPRMLAATIVTTILLGAAYLVFHRVADSMREPRS